MYKNQYYIQIAVYQYTAIYTCI